MYNKLKILHRYLVSNGFENEASNLIKLSGGQDNLCDTYFSTCPGAEKSIDAVFTSSLKTGWGFASSLIEWSPNQQEEAWDENAAWIPSKGPVSGTMTLKNPGVPLMPDCAPAKRAEVVAKAKEAINSWITESPLNLIIDRIDDPSVGICLKDSIELVVKIYPKDNVPDSVRVCLCFKEGQEESDLVMLVNVTGLSTDTIGLKAPTLHRGEGDGDKGADADLHPSKGEGVPGVVTEFDEREDAVTERPSLQVVRDKLAGPAVDRYKDDIKELFTEAKISHHVVSMQQIAWQYAFHVIPGDTSGWRIINHEDSYIRDKPTENQLISVNSRDLSNSTQFRAHEEVKKYIDHLLGVPNLSWENVLYSAPYNAKERLAGLVEEQIKSELAENLWSGKQDPSVEAINGRIERRILAINSRPKYYYYPLLFDLIRQMYIKKGKLSRRQSASITNQLNSLQQKANIHEDNRKSNAQIEPFE
jgi:hypothetical protein